MFHSRSGIGMYEYDLEFDVCTTAERFHDLQFASWSTPPPQQMEKQISVDPVSLRLPPIVTAAPKIPPPPPLISCSLPSPRFGYWLKKKFKNESQASPRQIDGRRKGSTVYPRRHNHPRIKMEQEIHLRRSKSCAEGRSSGVDELDIWFRNPGEPTTTESDTNASPMAGKKKREVDMDNDDDEFKCGALCLYLPGFGGGGGKTTKPMRERKATVESGAATAVRESVISRTVSLEKFECGSWASSAFINDGGESTRFYYDLPMELIKTGGNGTNSPVTSAFVFEKDRRGALNSCSARRKSHESSSRHVRFSSSSSSSTSNPSSPAACITPRLRKAREEFNAFLEAEARSA
ncbi:unnamed protein product [Linum trigynum]|uniref:Uncharacterized protein n=1 Tax=Linum trigynum TaxID=586398 RepID=A0AAV2CYW2_9ROSI